MFCVVVSVTNAISILLHYTDFLLTQHGFGLEYILLTWNIHFLNVFLFYILAY